MVVVFYSPWEWGRPLSAIIFTIAGFTDWLDGHLARKWGQSSPFGAFLDPVADKLMVAIALVMLVQAHPSMSMAIAAAVIIGREITISALRECMAQIGKRSKVAVSLTGKFKTTVQIIAIICLLFEHHLGFVDLFLLGQWLLYVAVLLTLWSMVSYIQAAWPSLKAGHAEDEAHRSTGDEENH